ncbi:MAG: hypothetical protein JSS49_12435 [Planctomycetes bacterium]|nr:hypothetical protein [Planctomycetota bacterium]
MSTIPVSRPWLRSPVWDGFWILSGLWLLVPVLLSPVITEADQWVLVAAVYVLWLPHRFATAFNAYCLPAYQNLIHAQWTRFFAVPASIFTVTFLFLFLPEMLLPLPLVTRVQVLATIFFIYNSYHFGVQHFGVLSIYRIRAAQAQDQRAKAMERGYCLIVGGLLVCVAQILAGAEIVRDSLLYQTVPLERLHSAMTMATWMAAPVIVLLTLGLLLTESRNPHRSPPKMLYIVSVGVQGVLAYSLPPPTFLMLWGVQHWLVSVALTAVISGNDHPQEISASAWYRFWGLFYGRFWTTVLVLFLTTIVLVPLFELSLHTERPHSGLLQQIATILAQHPLLARTLLWLNFATVYLHFVMDRAVFRFSHPDVRKVTGVLLFARD